MYALAFMLAAVALAGPMFPPGLAATGATVVEVDTAMPEDGGVYAPHSQTGFGADSVESRVQAAVVQALTLYLLEGEDALGLIMPADIPDADAAYQFVLDAATLEMVARGAFPDLSGVKVDAINMADRPADRILDDLERDGGTWVEYLATNPVNGLVQPKRTWLYLYDGYIFGSGHYLPESEVKYLVADTILLYKSEGPNAFDMITPEAALPTSGLYPFVFNASTLKTVAHGAIPDRVGHVPYAIIHTGDRPIEVVLDDLHRDASTWVEYVFTNPDSGTAQLKRTWLQLFDGYIFASGYYLPDHALQSQVDEAISLYGLYGEGSFETITGSGEHAATHGAPDRGCAGPMAGMAKGPTAPHRFVLNGTVLETVAHAGLPGKVGSIDGGLATVLEGALSGLREGGDVWTSYMYENPHTCTQQLARTYLTAHDGYIFGSGYFMPDSRAQSLVDRAIYTYKSQQGADAFADIGSWKFDRSDMYSFVRNATHVVAHSTVPYLEGPLSQMRETSLGAIPAAEGTGTSAWQVFVSTSPYTSTLQVSRAYVSPYDNYLFGSVYSVADAGARSAVDHAMLIYGSDTGNGAWMDMLGPGGPIATDYGHPFVLNATTWTEAAGELPDGEVAAMQETSVKPFGKILEDLEDHGETWVLHLSTHPDTGAEQYKRTYLEVRDGFVFGAGYYILDSQAQAIVHLGISEYGREGGDAPGSGILGTVPNQLFAVDPYTGMAQQVGRYASEASDWESISRSASVEGILDELEDGYGEWVVYEFANPLTGTVEVKRAWLALHDGLVFGSGYSGGR